MKTKMYFTQDHLSYQLHRRQVWEQILLPILLTVILIIAIIVLTSIATFRDNGDVARWAAISTIWLVIPVMLAGLILLAILFAVIFLFAKVLGVIPPYSYQAQKYVYRIEGYVRRGTEMLVKPALLVDVIKSHIKKAAERR